jgi:hypothetical protein
MDNVRPGGSAALDSEDRRRHGVVPDVAGRVADERLRLPACMGVWRRVRRHGACKHRSCRHPRRCPERQVELHPGQGVWPDDQVHPVHPSRTQLVGRHKGRLQPRADRLLRRASPRFRPLPHRPRQLWEARHRDDDGLGQAQEVIADTRSRRGASPRPTTRPRPAPASSTEPSRSDLTRRKTSAAG